jgi:hypothetical protein
VAVTYANGVETLYIDGTAVGSQSVTQTSYDSAYSYFLGTGYTSSWPGGNGGWHFFSGKLDEAAIYQRALTSNEVAQHFAAGGVSGPPPVTGAFDIQFRFTGLTAEQQAVFDQAAARWESVIVGDLANATYQGVAVDDLLIDASAVAIDGQGGILGQAGPDALRNGSRLPYHGSMQFDSADLAWMLSNGLMLSVIEHEMGHVLGIGTIWSSKGLLSGAGTDNPLFLGAQATAAYNAIYGTNAAGVPVENTGGSGTRDAHWRESIFGSELMTGWAGPGSNLPLSRITIGSLADIGYTVNMASADNFTPAIAASGAILAAGSASGANAGSSVEEAIDQILADWEALDFPQAAKLRSVLRSPS